MGVTIDKNKSFSFNGTSSASFDLICSGGGTYSAPKRSYETVSVPGRDGSLLIDNGYYEDIEVTYKEVGFVEDDTEDESLNLLLDSNVQNRGWSTTTYPCASYTLLKPLVSGQTYTWTIWGSFTSIACVDIYFGGGSIGTGWVTISSNQTKVTKTFRATDAMTEKTFINVYTRQNVNTASIGSGKAVINKIKLEKGSVATNWSEAKESLAHKVERVRSWLLSPLGYQALRDSRHPDEYRLAYISDTFDPEMLDLLNGGKVDIKFKAKPQRFLDSGNVCVVTPNHTTLNNPTGFRSVPKIIVKGSGTLTLVTTGYNFSIVVSGNSGAIYIDENMDATNTSGGSMNSYVKYNLDNAEKITLGQTTTVIQYSGFSEVQIQPNWWRL